MERTLLFPLSKLNKDLVEGLKQAYPDGVARIDPARLRPSGDPKEPLFWKTLTHLDWSKSDPEEVLEPAVVCLSRQPAPVIQGFSELLDFYLHCLFLVHGSQAACLCKGFGSELAPLFHFCWVIAQGQDHFQSVICDAAWRPGKASFQELLFLADEAFSRKTGLPDLRYY
jgi:hypothetical protein